MITPANINELATREQTSEINIAREYLQHLFLRELYKKDGADRFLFKGGTAIRVVYQGPRYSEDLDFSIPRMTKNEIEDIMEGTFTSLEQEGITTNLDIQEALPTSGGYLAIIQLDILGYKVEIKSNMQVKDDSVWLIPETHVIANPFLLAYSLVALRGELIVKEKINALIERHKPRDVFDAYFFARHSELRQYLPHDSETLERINKSLDEVSDHELEEALKPFLPRNYQSIIKQLKTSVRAELGIKSGRVTHLMGS